MLLEEIFSIPRFTARMFKENQRSGFNPTAKNGPDGNYYGATEDATYSYGRRSGLFPALYFKVFSSSVVLSIQV